MTNLKSGSAGGISSLLCRFFLIAALMFPGRILIGATLPGAVAAPCTLAWTPSSNPGVAGYAVYYGISGSPLNIRVDVGTASTITLYNLNANATYFFYAVAYDTSGQESIPSPTITYQPPLLSPVTLSFLPDGTANIGFRAPPGASCQVQYTPTLNPPAWQTLGTTVADSSGMVSVSDLLIGNPSMRFYRAVRLP
jgi:hypothetical protein